MANMPGMDESSEIPGIKPVKHGPNGHGSAILGEGGTHAHRMLVPAWGHRHEDFPGSDVDASGVGL